jgi:purine-cytosine permease-like protein
MFCFLAGSMITVSTTAVGVWFHVDMPKFSDVMPTSVSWIVMSVVVGGLIAIVAAFGYQAVSKFANVASPWMVLVFLAFGIIGLKQMGVTSLGDFWHVAETRIWKGGAPQTGHAKFTFWHVCFFAWFCNLAMHIGMADLSVFRFAKKSWYAISAGAGMYVGHFMAWICASVLYAVQLAADPKNTDVLPGPMADRACGIAGLLCVIFAGWTTANPTIYRAGLAFQAIVPKWPRFTVTLVTGAIATVAGVFPAVAMQLLGFVALYGMLLMPMGAVIFVDFWLLERLGMQSWYAERRGLMFNWAAALTWFLTLAACFLLYQFAHLEIFFISLPGWFVAALLYVVLSKIYQGRVPLVARAPTAKQFGAS